MKTANFSTSLWWVGGFFLLTFWSDAMPAVAQATPTVIPNTATAEFNSPGKPKQSIPSNTVKIPVQGGTAALEIIKIGDRASIEPGDAISYRLQIRNTGTASITDLKIKDTLPLGFKFLSKSPVGAVVNAAGAPQSQPSPISATMSGSVVTFSYPELQPQQSLVIAYAAVTSPDAVRGSGRNSAIAFGSSPSGPVNSNIASHRVLVQAGIVSDCGTLIGRVFEDKNFDGEQQPGEPGIPNAVVILEDGNRVMTDADGLYSLPYVLAGYHTGTLDLTSLPGYTIAPNLYRIDKNSTSRSVRLEPSGMARMNFAVTPTYREAVR
jgi:uncharacterized repeat protein (TIGR01451 family)